MDGPPRIILAISRQMGSGGSYLGQRVAQRLGFAYLDREILIQAAKTLGMKESDLEAHEERSATIWDRLLAAVAAGAPDSPYSPPPLRPVLDDQVQKVEAQIVRELASRQDSVVVGRGGCMVLRGQPGLVGVFIHAPLELRVRKIVEAYHIATEKEAHAAVERCDRDRQRFTKGLFNVEWTDARAYDLCVNTGATGFELAEKMILDLVRRRASDAGRQIEEQSATA